MLTLLQNISFFFFQSGAMNIAKQVPIRGLEVQANVVKRRRECGVRLIIDH